MDSRKPISSPMNTPGSGRSYSGDRSSYTSDNYSFQQSYPQNPDYSREYYWDRDRERNNPNNQQYPMYTQSYSPFQSSSDTWENFDFPPQPQQHTLRELPRHKSDYSYESDNVSYQRDVQSSSTRQDYYPSTYESYGSSSSSNVQDFSQRRQYSPSFSDDLRSTSHRPIQQHHGPSSTYTPWPSEQRRSSVESDNTPIDFTTSTSHVPPRQFPHNPPDISRQQFRSQQHSAQEELVPPGLQTHGTRQSTSQQQFRASAGPTQGTPCTPQSTSQQQYSASAGPNEGINLSEQSTSPEQFRASAGPTQGTPGTPQSTSLEQFRASTGPTRGIDFTPQSTSRQQYRASSGQTQGTPQTRNTTPRNSSQSSLLTPKSELQDEPDTPSSTISGVSPFTPQIQMKRPKLEKKESSSDTDIMILSDSDSEKGTKQDSDEDELIHCLVRRSVIEEHFNLDKLIKNEQGEETAVVSLRGPSDKKMTSAKKNLIGNIPSRVADKRVKYTAETDVQSLSPHSRSKYFSAMRQRKRRNNKVDVDDETKTKWLEKEALRSRENRRKAKDDKEQSAKVRQQTCESVEQEKPKSVTSGSGSAGASGPNTKLKVKLNLPRRNKSNDDNDDSDEIVALQGEEDEENTPPRSSSGRTSRSAGRTARGKKRSSTGGDKSEPDDKKPKVQAARGRGGRGRGRGGRGGGSKRLKVSEWSETEQEKEQRLKLSARCKEKSEELKKTQEKEDDSQSYDSITVLKNFAKNLGWETTGGNECEKEEKNLEKTEKSPTRRSPSPPSEKEPARTSRLSTRNKKSPTRRSPTPPCKNQPAGTSGLSTGNKKSPTRRSPSPPGENQPAGTSGLSTGNKKSPTRRSPSPPSENETTRTSRLSLRKRKTRAKVNYCETKVSSEEGEESGENTQEKKEEGVDEITKATEVEKSKKEGDDEANDEGTIEMERLDLDGEEFRPYAKDIRQLIKDENEVRFKEGRQEYTIKEIRERIKSMLQLATGKTRIAKKYVDNVLFLTDSEDSKSEFENPDENKFFLLSDDEIKALDSISDEQMNELVSYMTLLKYRFMNSLFDIRKHHVDPRCWLKESFAKARSRRMNNDSKLDYGTLNDAEDALLVCVAEYKEKEEMEDIAKKIDKVENNGGEREVPSSREQIKEKTKEFKKEYEEIVGRDEKEGKLTESNVLCTTIVTEMLQEGAFKSPVSQVSSAVADYGFDNDDDEDVDKDLMLLSQKDYGSQIQEFEKDELYLGPTQDYSKKSDVREEDKEKEKELEKENSNILQDKKVETESDELKLGDREVRDPENDKEKPEENSVEELSHRNELTEKKGDSESDVTEKNENEGSVCEIEEDSNKNLPENKVEKESDVLKVQDPNARDKDKEKEEVSVPEGQKDKSKDSADTDVHCQPNAPVLPCEGDKSKHSPEKASGENDKKAESEGDVRDEEKPKNESVDEKEKKEKSSEDVIQNDDKYFEVGSYVLVNYGNEKLPALITQIVDKTEDVDFDFKIQYFIKVQNLGYRLNELNYHIWRKEIITKLHPPEEKKEISPITGKSVRVNIFEELKM